MRDVSLTDQPTNPVNQEQAENNKIKPTIITNTIFSY